MPTLLRVNGFRFFFYSNENDEPIHVHVTKGNADGKIWLEPEIKVAYLNGFSTRDRRKIKEIIGEDKNLEMFKQKWNEYFSK